MQVIYLKKAKDIRLGIINYFSLNYGILYLDID